MSRTKTIPDAKRAQWIAERTLVRTDVTGGRVVVRLGAPEADPDCPHGRDWRCPFEIRGLGDEKIHFARGIETMDTLQNTLRGIRSVLDLSGAPLRWELTEGDNIGFPMYVDQGFGHAFEQRMERMILVEVEKLCRVSHDCLAEVGPRVATLEAKYETHGLVESAKRMLAELQNMNNSASAETTSKARKSRWIAKRTLVCFEHDERRVVVRIGRPEMAPTDAAWRCPFEIIGLPEDIKEFGVGVDSIHALQNALHDIRNMLLASNISMRWEGVRAADPAFPMIIPMGFGRVFEQRMVKMIADKLEERVRPIRERNERRKPVYEPRRKARKKTI